MLQPFQNGQQFRNRHPVVGEAGAQALVFRRQLRDAGIGVCFLPLQAFDARGGGDQFLPERRRFGGQRVALFLGGGQLRLTLFQLR